MSIKEITKLFERDIAKLKSEIDAYTKEENLWKVESNIANSAGNLCLHLIGNMSHFVGREMGGFEYVRDRDFEFAGKHIPKAELISGIDELQKIVMASLEGMEGEMLEKDYPLEVFGSKMTHGFFLVHLFGHFSYHLGQINYHRRLLDR